LHPITFRKVSFEFPDQVSPMLAEGDSVESYFLVAFSLLLPHLEPYLIRSMQEAKGQVRDAALLEDLKGFCAQEGQHYRVHRELNDRMRLEGYPKLAMFEAELEADYQRFSKRRSLQFNLAYAEGFEALTQQVAKYWLTSERFSTDSPIEDMILWHLYEELEHATVAFDVYQHLYGGYAYRVLVGMRAQFHFIHWVHRVSLYLQSILPHDERRKTRSSGLFGLIRMTYRDVLRTYSPRYDPRHHREHGSRVRALADRYDAAARRSR
jgi:predicted metal-dependent hydrolase